MRAHILTVGDLKKAIEPWNDSAEVWVGVDLLELRPAVDTETMGPDSTGARDGFLVRAQDPNHGCVGVARAAAKPKCPQCAAELVRVDFPILSVLNEEQWKSQRAGDWLCESCPDNDRAKNGKCYWWDREVTTVSPQREAQIVGEWRRDAQRSIREQVDGEIIKDFQRAVGQQRGDGMPADEASGTPNPSIGDTNSPIVKLAIAQYCSIKRMNHADSCAVRVALKVKLESDPVGLLRYMATATLRAIEEPETMSEDAMRRDLELPACTCEWQIAYDAIVSLVGVEPLKKIDVLIAEKAVEQAGGIEKVRAEMEAHQREAAEEEAALEARRKTQCGAPNKTATRHCVRLKDHTEINPDGKRVVVHTDGQEIWE